MKSLFAQYYGLDGTLSPSRLKDEFLKHGRLDFPET